MNKGLAKKIDEMTQRDQDMRLRVQKGGEWDYSIDRLNTEELKNIINKYGWPTINLVGKKASNNAWLIAQHADHDREFQKEVLDILIKIDKEEPGSVSKSNIAYLTDRILVAEGKEQEFGTQFHVEKGSLSLRPTREIKNVNQRRAEYGLDAIERYIEDAKKHVPPQTNFQKDQRRRLKKSP